MRQASSGIHCPAPFVVIASSDAQGLSDVSPRGDLPGFVAAPDDHTLLLPDRPGNKKLETLSNILQNPNIALIFFVRTIRCV